MAMLSRSGSSLLKNTDRPASIVNEVHRTVREQLYRKQLVNVVLVVITIFQLVGLPGAIEMKSAASIWTIVLGLALCSLAGIFNQMGKVAIVAVLLIVVVDLGCGLMLLTTPMGLDVSDLPIFDVLIISELIAVSLLTPNSVFPVALSNIAFIVADLIFQPRTMEMQMVLTGSMGFSAIAQPISLQIVVAVVAYVWVRNALLALARADRAEELAELQRREAERQQELEEGVEHISQILVQAANGNRSVRAQMNQENALWRISNSLNLLLTRLMRVGQIEQENKQLRAELTRITEARHLDKLKSVMYTPRQPDYNHHNRNNPFSNPGL